MTPEAAFVKAWGREPTTEEVERLRRLREAFSIDENDALLTIAMVLEFYDGRYRLYPEKCGQASLEAVSRWMASSNGRSVLRDALRLAAGQSASSGFVGGAEGAETRRDLIWVTLGGIGMASSAVSAALGMRVSLALAGSYPCWVPHTASSSIAVNLLGAPMGWLVVWALLVPVAWGAFWGWTRGRDRARSIWQRLGGWTLVGALGVGVAGWCILLWQLPSARP